MKAQITLTVPGSKRFIAKGIAALPSVRAALETGKLLLKGGTTVSALAEELGYGCLRVAGRVSPLGAKQSIVKPEDSDATHIVVFEQGVARDAFWNLEETVLGLGPGDVIVLPANAIDAYGGAALMAGGQLGGPPGRVWMGIQTGGAEIVVAAGIEKLIPGRITDVVRVAAMRGIDLTMGMPVGLMPIFGKVITEVEASLALGAEKAAVIAAGGIDGAEGAVTLLVEGEREPVTAIFRLALKLSRATHSGTATTLLECRPGSTAACNQHHTCVYHHPELLR